MMLKQKPLIFFIWLSILLILSSSPYASLLKNHPSPYLKLHAEDPVDWQVWGDKVLHQAQAEDKLIFVSIGYFSCHWCHVMQRESYADPEVGKLMNQHFISVKVDRELRPELDRRLVQFVEEVRGVAGWPLNVFLTPEGYPLTGFTYLPRASFVDVIDQLVEQWQQRRDEITPAAKSYFEQTEYHENRATLVNLPDQHRAKVLDAFVSQAMLIADELQGGFGQTQKFPSYPQFNALLEAIRLRPDIDPDVIDFAQLTLDVMASRHLMDHVNDGFFRYVTDPDWQTPHFEKMLYDNAQLAALYLDAESLWPGRGYADIALRTIDFIQRFLADPAGGYYSSLSAVDTDDIEGGAYYWSREQLRASLTADEYQRLLESQAIEPAASEPLLLKPLIGIGSASGQVAVNQRIRARLQAAPRPLMPVDDKKLASWNALTLKALVKAVAYDNSASNRQRAQQLYRFISRQFIQGQGEQLRVIRFAGQGQSAETTLEDYAQLAHALQLYANQLQDQQAQSLATQLVQQAFAQYYQAPRWLQDRQSLIPGDRGQLLIQDGVLQSPLSLLLETVLLQSGGDQQLLASSRELAGRLTRDVLETPYYYGSGILLFDQTGANQPDREE
ncbi:MAG: DUF255 domain-containing protein [Gammaproteobacteria bacterium]|nr:DUF255 domain-containing protein [Gammaproteobacteria bacterium]